MAFIYKIFLFFHIFFCVFLSQAAKRRNIHTESINQHKQAGIQHQVASCNEGAWIENTGDMRITHRRSMKYNLVRKEMENFSKSFPKVFDKDKAAICVMKTKGKGRGLFCTYRFFGGDAPGNGGIGCTKGREAQLHEAAAGRLIGGIVL